MKIAKDTAVTLQYQISNAASPAPLSAKPQTVDYLHGGYDNLFPLVEAALEGQEVGFATTLLLEPDDAFGPLQPALRHTIPKSDFPSGVKVGGTLRAVNKDGEERIFRVVKIKGQEVHLDANHEMAGMTVRFTFKVTHVRAATAEEIAHKHVHGEHGHQH